MRRDSIHGRLTALLLCLVLLGAGTGASAQQQNDQLHRRFLDRLIRANARGEIAEKPVATFMQEEKIAFLQGGFEELAALCHDTAASMEVTLVDGKRYAVSFLRDGQRRVTIAYPVDYQLILGVTMMEVEDRLADAIRMTPIPTDTTMHVDEELLQREGNNSILLLKGDSYIIPELNANRYFVCQEGLGYQLLYSRDLPLETVANLVTGTELATDIMLNISLVKYGYRTEQFTVPLRQWIAYCMAEGCTPYYGTISRSDDQVVGELVMHNETLGYAHIMKLSFNPAILATDGDAPRTIDSRLNSYVPLSNVKSLFKEDEYK